MKSNERDTTMLLTRWSPLNEGWREFHRLHDEVNRLFGRYANDRRDTHAPAGFPALNVWEDADSVYAESELPGMALKDLEILVTGKNQLTIKGTRRPPTAENATWHRQERGFGEFARVITLPVAVDAERVSADFQHGVLTIKMPKSEAAKPRRIPIQAE
jgi:HSP20 family protein